MFCDKCKMVNRTQFQHGRGNGNADIMIVLDSPTMGCAKERKFLSGDVYYKVRYLLEKAGLDFNKIYFTSAIKCPSKKPSDIKAKYVNTCRDFLFDEILKIKPKLIIPMGKYARQAVEDDESIKEFRGHFSNFELDYEKETRKGIENRNFKCTILPTLSPVTALSKWEHDIYIIHDLKKAKKFIKTGTYTELTAPKFNVALDRKSLDQMREELTNTKALVIDFETTGFRFFEHEIINAGYCTSNEKVWITYLSGFPKSAYKKFTDEEKKRADIINKFVKENRDYVVKTLKAINGSKNVKKIGHNLKFDCKFALSHKIPIKNYYFDTVIADALLDENRYHDLNSVMEFNGLDFGAYDTKLWPYTNKDEKKKKPYNNIPPQLLEKYLAIDVYGCWKVFKKIYKDLKKEPKLYKYMFNQQMPLTKALLEIEYRGFRIDKKRLLEAHETLNTEINDLLQKIRNHVKDQEFNPNSPEQVSKYMEMKGYPFEKYQVKRGAKGYSTGAAVLEKFQTIKKWSKLPTLLLRYRKLSKYNGTFIYGPVKKGKPKPTGLYPLLDKNGFVHTNYNVHTPRTGRVSSSDPNAQTYPREDETLPSIRQCFIADKDEDQCVFEGDYKSLEVVISAWLSKDKHLIKLLEKGTDMHSYNLINVGSKIGMIDPNITYEEFKYVLDYKGDDSEMLDKKAHFKYLRFLTKSVVFGLNYGKEAVTFAKDLERPVEEMEDFIDGYFDLYSRVYKFREYVKDVAFEKGELKLKSGRRRRFHYAIDWIKSDWGKKAAFKTKLLLEEIYRQAMNFPVQGEANDVYVNGKLKLIRELKRRKIPASIRLTIHDGWVAVGYIKDLKEIEKICHEQMTKTVKIDDNKTIDIGIDFDAKTRWYGEKIEYK